MEQNWSNFITLLYSEEHERLFKVAYRKTKNGEIAQDLVQDVFLLAIFNQSKLKQHPKPGAWLMRTLQNLIMNESRAQLRKEISLDEVYDFPAQEVFDSVDEMLPTNLQAKEREILIWRFKLNMSYKEMSDQLDVSETLCRKWVSQAVIKCRKLLQKQ